jgi:hypothetical protein
MKSQSTNQQRTLGPISFTPEKEMTRRSEQRGQITSAEIKQQPRTGRFRHAEPATRTGDDLNCGDDYLRPATNPSLRERETEMQALSDYETLTGRFATTMSTIVMLIGLLFLTGSAAAAKTITVREQAIPSLLMASSLCARQSPPPTPTPHPATRRRVTRDSM